MTNTSYLGGIGRKITSLRPKVSKTLSQKFFLKKRKVWGHNLSSRALALGSVPGIGGKNINTIPPPWPLLPVASGLLLSLPYCDAARGQMLCSLTLQSPELLAK
jgi:hypothetical protein